MEQMPKRRKSSTESGSSTPAHSQKKELSSAMTSEGKYVTKSFYTSFFKRWKHLFVLYCFRVYFKFYFGCVNVVFNVYGIVIELFGLVTKDG